MTRKGFFLLSLVWMTTLSGCIFPESNTTDSASAPVSLPSTPRDVVLTPTGPHHVKISWSSTSSSQGGYVVSRSDNGGAFTQIAEVDAASHEFTDDGISLTVTYVYQVYATGIFGNSAPALSSEYKHPYVDACSQPTSPPPSPLHIFYDFPISGLNYYYSSSFAVTDSNGAFTWDQATTLPFSIGYVRVGSLKAGDRAGLKTLADNRGVSPDITLTNFLRLFIALDEDNNALNGIQLPCDLSLAYGEIDPSVDYTAFSQQETVYRLTGGSPLPSAQDAYNLYQQYLFQNYTGHYKLDWSAILSGMWPISGSVTFDIDAIGKVVNTAETVLDATVDPHSSYRLKYVDLAPLAYLNYGYYKMEITGYINSDQTFTGNVVIKNISPSLDISGPVTGGRI